MKKILTIFLSLLLASPAHATDANKLTIKSGKAKHVFNIEVADDDLEREKGLMYRTSLDKDAGMLFIFKFEDVQNFWMKNTFIPLDILFIKKDGRIAKIQNMANPQDLTLISSEVPIVAALEIKGGEAQKRGIKPGNKIIYPLFTK